MATYKQQKYLFMTLDPVHIGTGGYRLGRVDNSIVREPGTKIPKIPGTSLHGAARSYSAQLYETPAAAGQDQQGIDNPNENPVCYTFGYLQQNSNEPNQTVAYSGVVNISDAHIMLFPVYSMAGPVWVSTLDRLKDAGVEVASLPNPWDTGIVLDWNRTDPLNLGWLMLNVAGKFTIKPPHWENNTRWKSISSRIVLVKDALFSQVVNSNLEVRTSVAIDPEQGAAEDKALFTYEAIPRATFLTAEVVLDDYRSGEHGWPLGNISQTASNKPLPGNPWQSPLDVVKAGFRMIEWLGVGGMGTRGFGRMAIIGEPADISLNEYLNQESSNEQHTS